MIRYEKGQQIHGEDKRLFNQVMSEFVALHSESCRREGIDLESTRSNKVRFKSDRSLNRVSVLLDLNQYMLPDRFEPRSSISSEPDVFKRWIHTSKKDPSISHQRSMIQTQSALHSTTRQDPQLLLRHQPLTLLLLQLQGERVREQPLVQNLQVAEKGTGREDLNLNTTPLGPHTMFSKASALPISTWTQLTL